MRTVRSPAAPASGRHRRWSGIAARVVGGALAAVVGVAWSWCVARVLLSRFASFEAATDPDSVAFDPHGFGLIFGTMLAVPLGLVLALTVPVVFPRDRRAAARRRAMAVYAVVTVLLLVAVFSG